ncbi:saccharopine dehydrogenase NADP-binding domain-containing protein [Georgenia sp. 10Sc9-8]|uniref:Saccharopine dehydrogenase NADP-binding domain-containing protein n=1 Tax=Georgenia halotolerans TaxID=3028317 RepID=A0ABT5TVD9_9MICO|nr:saccharopine dehydrogenase NADP-binding domain-containing protein [Georgenia halotolerans]
MDGPDLDGRPLDVVLFGASGFVGRLVADYLARSAGPTVRVGLAGRSQDRLERLRADLGPAAADWDVLVADAGDPAALERLARATRVVATTVGPYTRRGLPLVQACAENGTGYVDLTGEVLFMRDSADRFHDTARSTGARIVHACGFDSVPSDLAVRRTAERARADGEGRLRHTTLLVRSLAGGVSGGTIDSMRVQVDAARDPANRRVIADPYALSPDRSAEPEAGDQRDAARPFREVMTGTWAAPFPMAGVNTRVVRRSNALQEWRYGRGLRYRELVACGTGPRGAARAALLTLGLGAAVVGMAVPPVRWVLDRVLPAPGDGPDEETRRSGSFRLEVQARTTTGARYRTTFAAQGDPGYAATAVMFGESALALALDGDRLPAGAGVLTPATALGDVLDARLRAAGVQITTERVGAEERQGTRSPSGP